MNGRSIDRPSRALVRLIHARQMLCEREGHAVMMTTERNDMLSGLRILLVEDWLIVAQEIEMMLEALGCEIVGPAATVEKALKLARAGNIDGALLDVNLDNEEVFPVADELLMRGAPFIFMTGYDAWSMPAELRELPRLQKPFGFEEFAAAALSAFGRRVAAEG